MRKTSSLRVAALFLERKRIAGFLVALVVLAAGFEIAVPFIIQHLIDTLIGFFKSPARNPMQVLLAPAAGILAATVLTRVVKSVYDYHLFKTSTSLEDQIKNRAFEKYLTMHALFHSESNSGQIIGRIERGSTAVYTMLYDIFGQSLAPPLIVFAGVLISLAFKNVWIALIVFLPLPLYLLVVRRLTQRIYEIERQVSEHFEVVAKESYDVASNVSTVKKFSQEIAETRNQARLLTTARSTQYGAERLWAVIENTQTLIATTGRVSIILVGGLFVLWGKSTVGEFVLYVTLQSMAYQPMAQLSIIFPRMRRNMSRVERVFALLEERVFALLEERNGVQDKPNATGLAPLERCIEFRNVWFRYGTDKRWILQDANVRIPAGATVALIGTSGSGKSTFINLLLRSFDPERGSILVDGVDIREATQESLRRQTAIVPQEVDLFSRTIAENIAYGKVGATREDVVRAARIARAHDFIDRTERGYDTVVGERGLKLNAT